MVSIIKLRNRSAKRDMPSDKVRLDRCATSSTSDDDDDSLSPFHWEEKQVESFIHRSVSVCSFDERFTDRREQLLQESRSNPYIGYFLRHDSRPYSSRRASAEYLRPLPAIKYVSGQSMALPSPNMDEARTVRFSNTVRESSIVSTQWGCDSGKYRDPSLSISESPRSSSIFTTSLYASHGVAF